MITVNDVLNVFRRRIGDTDAPVTYADDLLIGYISDAVDQVELEFTRGISVNITKDPVSNITTGTFNTTDGLDKIDCQLYALKAHYMITLRTKDKSDRDNFRMVKGRLTLDNTNQSKDHAETLRLIDAEFKRVLYRVKNGDSTIKGVRVE